MKINEVRESCRVAVYHAIKATKRNPAPSKELLEEQYRTIAEQHGWCISLFYFDEGKNHARLDQLIADCKSRGIDLVICKDLMCFCYNTKELIRVAGELAGLEKPVGIWFEDPKLFTLDDAGNLMLTILGVVAEEESRQKSMIMKNSWAARRKKEVNHE